MMNHTPGYFRGAMDQLPTKFLEFTKETHVLHTCTARLRSSVLA